MTRTISLSCCVLMMLAGLTACEDRSTPPAPPADPQIDTPVTPDARPVTPDAPADPENGEAMMPDEPSPATNGDEHHPDSVALFDGTSLENWEKTNFGGEGEVWIEDGALHIGRGEMLSGVTWQGEVLRDNYEITLQAKRVEGGDFFCGLTFPVGDDGYASLILGGWGGSTCGISSIDGYDAANNETTFIYQFEDDRWYDVRVRVTPATLICWVDGEQVIYAHREYRNFDVRIEVELSKPLGLATFRTHGAFRDLRIRPLDDN